MALAEQGEDLARSNADLEQFAYVASHDLSEPLRKVANFCQLLERQYGPQLDDKARQYIAFAVDGAKRMQVLIADLLAFSRVGRTTETFEPVDTGRALDRALANLDERVEDAGAQIVRGPLPTVPGDPTLITALFQNLVGNALKYRSPERRRGSRSPPNSRARNGPSGSRTTASASTRSTASGSSRSSSGCTCATSTAGRASGWRCAARSSSSIAAASGSAGRTTRVLPFCSRSPSAPRPEMFVTISMST